MIRTDAVTLSAMWESIRDQKPEVRPAAVSIGVLAIVERGWAPRYRIEDLLHDMGAGYFWQQAEVNTLFDVPRQPIYDRPKSRSNWVMGSDETAAADVAFILSQMERLGLGIDPLPLVEALRPPLLNRTVLTRSELHVLWYAKERHKTEPLTVATPDTPFPIGEGQVKLPTGYKVALQHDTAGNLLSFTVTAPKYRRKASSF